MPVEKTSICRWKFTSIQGSELNELEDRLHMVAENAQQPSANRPFSAIRARKSVL